MEKMNPILSIIIPFFNGEKYLEKCINCIRNLSYSNWELILVNDGSNDNSQKICESFISEDNRIRLYNKKNGGVSSARNYGILNAKGEWIYFVDCDDWIDSHACDILNSSLDYDLVVHGLSDDFPDDNRVIQSEYCDINGLSMIETIYYLDEWGLLKGPVNKFFKKNILLQNNIIFDESIYFGEDTKFTFEYLRCCRSVYFVPGHFYHYIHRKEESLSAKKYNYLQWVGIAEMLKDVRMPLLEAYNYHQTYSNFVYEVYWYYIMKAFISLYIRETREPFSKRYKILNSEGAHYLNSGIKSYSRKQEVFVFLLRYPLLFDAVFNCLGIFRFLKI